MPWEPLEGGGGGTTEQDLVSVKNGILKLKDVRDERNEWLMRTRETLG